MENRVILSIKDLVVKFRVRSRVLTAIRNISFDIYDGETIAIVGESGSGKSVLTKTFTNMLESNGYIAKGSINYYPSDASKNDLKTKIRKNVDLVSYHRNALERQTIKQIVKANKKQIKELETKLANLASFSIEAAQAKIVDLNQEIESLKQQLKSEFTKTNKINRQISKHNQEISDLNQEINQANDPTSVQRMTNNINDLKEENAHFKWVDKEKRHQINDGINLLKKYFVKETTKSSLEAFYEGFLNKLEYRNITENNLYDAYFAILNDDHYELSQDEIDFIEEGWKSEKQFQTISKFGSQRNLRNLRGATIATIFQDPMTSLDPLLSVGYQVIQALKNNANLTHLQARKEAIELLERVGIPNAKKRMKDLPGKYSGGMRQRVVIAIALACKPKILICDEPTTALDVTIQAQILDLIKELKKEYGFTVVFITHDLGVVANIADRVAIVYAGQIIEYGKIKEIYFNPQHPYTWALLSSLPQLGTKGEDLFSLAGTPPSLFNVIKGDAFAPRNKYALEIDYLYEPPLFEVSPTHFAKTWLLDSRAPKVSRPKELSNLRQAISEMKVGD